MKRTVTQDTFCLAEAFTISRGSRTEARVLTVHLDDGTHRGWGECVPYSRFGETLDSVTAQIDALPEKIDRAKLQQTMRPGAGRFAMDSALWDIEAKRSGRRVWDLAGLPVPGPEITAFTLSLDTPEKMRMAAVRHARRPILMIKLGTPDDMSRLEAVRAGCGDHRGCQRGVECGGLFGTCPAPDEDGCEAGGTADASRYRRHVG